MADAPDPIAELAVGLNEDAKAKRKRGGSKPEAAAEPEAEPVQAVEEVPAGGEGPEVDEELGPRETNHLAYLESLEEVAEALTISPADTKFLVALIRDSMADVLRNRPKAWNDLFEPEQRDVLTGLEDAAKTMVRKALVAIASEKRPHVRAKLEGYAEKDGIKINLSLGAMTPADQELAVVALHRSAKKDVLIITADAAVYDKPKPPKVSPDAPDLGFDPPPSDDSDLAGEEPAEVEE